MNMQKHYVLAALTPTAYAAISSQMNMNHAVPMYLVSEVDARIAQLEKALRESGHLQIFTETTHCHVNGLRYAHMCGGCKALVNSGLMDR
jgi:hypothetical protein